MDVMYLIEFRLLSLAVIVFALAQFINTTAEITQAICFYVVFEWPLRRRQTKIFFIS